MCGIAGIVCHLDERPDSIGPVLEKIESAIGPLAASSDIEAHVSALTVAEESTRVLRREGASWQLARSPEWVTRLQKVAETVETLEREGAARLSSKGASVQTAVVEQWNSVWVRCRDLAWLIREDVLAFARRVPELVGHEATGNRRLYHNGWKLTAALNSLGRLEVRGRDSLGLSVMVTFPGQPALADWAASNRAEIDRRGAIRDFTDASMVTANASAIFTYKVAQEVGALGDNVAKLVSEISQDKLLLALISRQDTSTNVFGHTRWASNGIINEQNCHPVNQETLQNGRPAPEKYWVSAVLNGDIDNYQALRARFEKETGRVISSGITTDTKIIPVMVSYYYEKTGSMQEAFRRAVGEFEGSLAISMHSTLEPDRIYLALAGSGQSLCVGLTQDGYMVASELYGAVELTDRFVRMDGTKERVPGRPETRGQLFVLDASKREAGLAGLTAMSFDGVALELGESDVKSSEITTRDINRAGFQHYLLKEINESPRSIARTLAGKFLLDREHQKVTWQIGETTIPTRVLEPLKQGRIREIVIIGQGTAAVAGDAFGVYMRSMLGSKKVTVRSTKATEFSGYHMADDLSSTLVIAVSQSGTTTDTNRTIDLARSRGAAVVGIVNRRNSDLVYKVDGVLYTSDGRDIEMSVASTKAFYSQVTAGYILALYFAHVLETQPEHVIAAELTELTRLPQIMEKVLSRQSEVEALARTTATFKRDWAVAGSGANRPAADEVRIKLSELCYKSIATDSIEDKKHIDLSSEPLVLVCAAGLPAVALKDAVKEVAIFKSHKSFSIVICSEDAQGFEPYATGILRVPNASEAASVLLNTLVGHLWGYYSARSIDEGAAALRRVRGLAVKQVMPSEDGATVTAHRENLERACRDILGELRSGRYNSSLSSNVASKVSLLFEYVMGRLPLSCFSEDFADVATPSRLYDTVIQGITQAVQELSRPIDAIKHQAKTVTVGISRTEEELRGPLFDGLKEAGVSLESISYKDLTMLKALTPAIAKVVGATRYSIAALGDLGEPNDRTKIKVETKTGIAKGMASRIDRNPALTGTKQWVVSQRTAYVGEGHSDKRSIVILPLMTRGVCDGLVLLHLEYRDELPVGDKRALVHQIHHRYEELRALVTESNVAWKDEHLQGFTPRELVSVPIKELATRIVSGAQRS